MEQVLFGINPVLELLQHEPQRVQKIFLPLGTLSGKKNLVNTLAQRYNIKIQRIPGARFEKLVGKAVHQDVVAEIVPYDYQNLETLLEGWKASYEKALFVVLDGIEDPHNLGAIIRTAHTAGAHGLIVPKHRCAPLNSTTAKASAGALAHMPVCRVPNLAAALRLLKSEGVWIVGTAEEASQSLYRSDLTLDLAVVIGGEGKGIHHLIKKTCDFLVSIPTRGKIQSLNASVAAGVVLFEVVRQRGG
jgi:23S rRNA (guanosine2251-2'-O)-methyltransferase